MRGALLGIVFGWVVVFVIAARLNPYDASGQPLRMEVHRQLGLPPCSFYTLTGGLPCPSCGMTTSFALLMHGDAVQSLYANAIGTFLAIGGMLMIPWGLVSAWRGRLLGMRSPEYVLTRLVIAFLILMMVRWLFVVAFHYAGWR